jgi:hypothetical protein
VAISALGLAAATAVTAPASPARAGVADVTCTPPSSQTNTYSPALTDTKQPTTDTYSDQLGPCVSLSQPGITSGTDIRQKNIPEQSCFDLLGSGSMTNTITWNTGQTSTYEENFTFTDVGAVVTFTGTGTVTSGLFAGDTVAVNATGVSTAIAECELGLGTVSSEYLTATLEITSV